MSLTKRHIDSLTEAEQNEILGMMNPDYEPIYELKPGIRRCQHRMRYTGNQCQLAEGHVLRHAWEPSWVERVARIEGAGQ